MSGPVDFATNTATIEQIAAHLSRCDDSFVPPLGSRTDVAEYALKIGTRAERIEAWAGRTLVGLVAIYSNEPIHRVAYITSFSVDSGFRSRGIGSELLARCIELTTRRGFEGIELEVHSSNAPAIDLYAKHGFAARGLRGEIVVMYLEPGRE